MLARLSGLLISPLVCKVKTCSQSTWLIHKISHYPEHKICVLSSKLYKCDFFHKDWIWLGGEDDDLTVTWVDIVLFPCGMSNMHESFVVTCSHLTCYPLVIRMPSGRMDDSQLHVLRYGYRKLFTWWYFLKFVKCISALWR